MKDCPIKGMNGAAQPCAAVPYSLTLTPEPLTAGERSEP